MKCSYSASNLTTAIQFIHTCLLLRNFQQTSLMLSYNYYQGDFLPGGDDRVRQWVGLHKIAPGVTGCPHPGKKSGNLKGLDKEKNRRIPL